MGQSRPGQISVEVEFKIGLISLLTKAETCDGKININDKHVPGKLFEFNRLGHTIGCCCWWREKTLCTNTVWAHKETEELSGLIS